jgi:predicted amidohydrolase YtcJ
MVNNLDADLLLINGKIVTMDQDDLLAEAVAVKYGKILKVSNTEEVLNYQGKDTKIIDLNGKTVVPGFIDSHCHMISVGALNLLRNVTLLDGI